MIPIYHGFDPREEYGSHTFVSSVLARASRPVSFTPLHLPLFRSFYSQRAGTNAFTFTRFLIPFLQGFRGWALFADGADMICKADIAELWALRFANHAVQVVKHDYRTKHPRKYVGTCMEAANDDYEGKNWSSLMLINCSHFAWRQMTPEAVETMPPLDLLQFKFIPADRIGELPLEWNWLADEYGENPDAKLLHWTAGIPGFPAYADTAQADDWAREACRVVHVTC